MKVITSLALLLGLLGHPHSLPAQTPKSTKVAILLYPGVELLDFAGPLEVFSLMEGAEVFTVAAKPGPMSTMKKMLTVTPNYTFANAPQPDILIVPGAPPDHVQTVVGDSSVINWIQRTAPGRQLTMSVCTGAYVLGKAGLLDGKTVTTHWAFTDMLQQMTPKARVMEHTRFVDNGNLITTAGVSAGIDGALRVVSRLKGPAAARAVAHDMEYDKWGPESGLIVGRQAGRPAKKTSATRVKPSLVKKTAATKLTASGLSSPIDPVCQMSVATHVADTAQYVGKRYGFCSKICKERFHQHPTAYVKPATR